MEYYTDDITCMPRAVIWRACRGTSPLLRVPLFLYLIARKALGRQFPASYGAARLAQFPEILPETVPRDVLAEMLPFIRASEAAGFKQTSFFRSPTIGAKESYFAILLDEAGYILPTVLWFRTSIGAATKSCTVFACHSLLTNGVELSTGSIGNETWRTELIPPFQDVLRLEGDVSPSEVIQSHRRRIRSTKDLVRFDRQSLSEYGLNSRTRLFDFMIENGYFVRLTDAEVQRLQGRINETT